MGALDYVVNSLDYVASGVLSVKHDMTAVFETLQSWPNVVAGTAKRRAIREALATPFELGEVTITLI